MSAARDIPDGLSMIFQQLLAEDPAWFRQIQAEHALHAANRHALLGPVVRGLQLLHDYWAYKGVGTLRREVRGFMTQWDFQASQRKAPAHEMTRLAAFLLLFVADQDGASQQAEAAPGLFSAYEESRSFVVPPPKLTQAMAQAYAQHIRTAYNSLHSPFAVWTAQSSEQNLLVLQALHHHSGYAQTKLVALTCLRIIKDAQWRLETVSSAAAVSRSWRNLFQTSCKGNKLVRALAQLILMKTRPGANLEDKWLGLRRDFWRAAQMAGPAAMIRWPSQPASPFMPAVA